MNEGQYRKALKIYLSILNQMPNDTPISVSFNDYKQTILISGRIRPLSRLSEDYRREMVIGLANVKNAKTQEDYRRAVGHFINAAKIAPWAPAPYEAMGHISETVGDYASAAGYLKLYLLADPKAPDARAMQDHIYVLEDKSKTSSFQLNEYGKVSTGSSIPLIGVSNLSPDSLYRQAWNDYLKMHFDLSEKEFGQVVSQYPDSHLASSSQFWVGQSEYKMNQISSAIHSYRLFIKKYPDSSKQAIAYFMLGMSFERIGNKKICHPLLSQSHRTVFIRQGTRQSCQKTPVSSRMIGEYLRKAACCSHAKGAVHEKT